MIGWASVPVWVVNINVPALGDKQNGRLSMLSPQAGRTVVERHLNEQPLGMQA